MDYNTLGFKDFLGLNVGQFSGLGINRSNTMANTTAQDIQVQIDTNRDLYTSKQAELSTIIADIASQYANIAAARADIVAVIATPPKTSYTVSGGGGTQTFDYNGYYAFLNQRLGQETNLLDVLLKGQDAIVKCLEMLQTQYGLLIKTKNQVAPYLYISRVF